MGIPLPIRKDLTLPSSDLDWTSVRASGPGGQNVNKVSSKVRLAFDFEGSVALSDALREKIRSRLSKHVDAEGQLVVVSQKTRDLYRNLADAREKLRALLLEAFHEDKLRKKTKPTQGAKKRRLSGKKKVSEKKVARRRVRED